MEHRGKYSPLARSLSIFGCAFAGCVFFSCAARSDIGRPKPVAKFESEFPTISLGQLPEVDLGSAKLSARSKPELVLEPIEDARTEKVVLRYQGKEVVPEGDATLGVGYALTKAFRQKGIALKDRAALHLQVRITGWNARVDGESVIGSAVLTAELVAGGEVPVFSGLFEGSSEQTSPAVLDRDVEIALQKAMGRALSELMQDAKLLDTLTAY